MRISDWSSDVCSSDLAVGGAVQVDRQDAPLPAAHRAAQGALRRRQAEVPDGDDGALQEGEDQPRRRLPAGAAADDHLHGAVLGADGVGGARQAPWTLWIHDLTARDPYFILPVLTIPNMWSTQQRSEDGRVGKGCVCT